MATPKIGRPRGRPKGARSKRTLAREEALRQAAARAAESLGALAFEGDAHALLVWAYKNPAVPIGMRLDAAKTAIGFEKPRLSSVEAKVEADVTVETVPPLELAREIAFILARGGEKQ